MSKTFALILAVLLIDAFSPTTAWSQSPKAVTVNSNGDTSALATPSTAVSLRRPTRPTTAIAIYRYVMGKYRLVKLDGDQRYEVQLVGVKLRVPYWVTEDEALMRLQSYYNNPLPNTRSEEISSLLVLLQPEQPKQVEYSDPGKEEATDTPGYKLKVYVNAPAIPDPNSWGMMRTTRVSQSVQTTDPNVRALQTTQISESSWRTPVSDVQEK